MAIYSLKGCWCTLYNIFQNDHSSNFSRRDARLHGSQDQQLNTNLNYTLEMALDLLSICSRVYSDRGKKTLNLLEYQRALFKNVRLLVYCIQHFPKLSFK